MTVLVAVAGAAPGVGKSTLCAGLAEWLSGRGMRVDHFREEDILTRAAFESVAAEFRDTGEVALSTLLAATAEFARTAQAARVDVVVADALVPFVPSLMAWGHSEEDIGRFVGDLARLLRPLAPVVIYLEGDPRTALLRAADREGPGWLDWFLAKLARSRGGPPVHDLDSAVAYLHAQRALTLRLLRGEPSWTTVVVEPMPPAKVRERTRHILAGLLTGHRRPAAGAG